MFSNAVVAIDGNDSGQDQAHLARRLCPASGRLTLARVHRGYNAVGSSGSTSRRDAEVRVAGIALQQAARSTGLTDMASIAAGSEEEGFTRLVADRCTDVLVAGSHGDRHGTVPFSDWLARALTEITCAIAVAPDGYQTAPEGPVRTVGVAYDDSDESRQALIFARQITRKKGVTLQGFRTPTTVSRESRYLRTQITEDLREFGAIVDLLVIGPRGAGPLDRLTHANATLSLLQGIRSPLLLVPQQARLPVGAVQVSDRRLTAKITRS